MIPYFKTGLKNNEFCIWITGELLNEKDITKAMRKSLPEFDYCLTKGQLQIFSYAEWYLKGGIFSPDKVLNTWANNYNQMRAEGYECMRVAGDPGPLVEKHWARLIDYEARVNDSIGNYQMIALCTYSIEKCKRFKSIDLIRTHQFTLGKWNEKTRRLGMPTTRTVDNRKSSLPGSVVISGHKILERSIAAETGLDYLYVDLELDPTNFKIIGFSCSEIDDLHLTKKAFQKTLLGRKLKVGIKNTIEKIKKDLLSPFQKDFISAFEDADKQYEKMNKICK